MNVNDDVFRLVTDLAKKEDGLKFEKNSCTAQEFKRIMIDNLSTKNKFLFFIYTARLAEVQGETLYDLVKNVEHAKNTGSHPILQKYKMSLQ